LAAPLDEVLQLLSIDANLAAQPKVGKDAVPNKFLDPGPLHSQDFRRLVRCQRL
jgi:hypothetical protein